MRFACVRPVGVLGHVASLEYDLVRRGGEGFDVLELAVHLVEASASPGGRLVHQHAVVGTDASVPSAEKKHRARACAVSKAVRPDLTSPHRVQFPVESLDRLAELLHRDHLVYGSEACMHVSADRHDVHVDGLGLFWEFERRSGCGFVCGRVCCCIVLLLLVCGPVSLIFFKGNVLQVGSGGALFHIAFAKPGARHVLEKVAQIEHPDLHHGSARQCSALRFEVLGLFLHQQLN